MDIFPPVSVLPETHPIVSSSSTHCFTVRLAFLCLPPFGFQCSGPSSSLLFRPSPALLFPCGLGSDMSSFQLLDTLLFVLPFTCNTELASVFFLALFGGSEDGVAPVAGGVGIAIAVQRCLCLCRCSGLARRVGGIQASSRCACRGGESLWGQEASAGQAENAEALW